MGRVIAIANQKGGVGKTTTAVNLAACLAAAEKRTLLIDLDPQGNATSGFGVDKNSLTATIYDLLIGDEVQVESVLMHTALEMLDLIPSNMQLAGAMVELVELSSRLSRLAGCIRLLRPTYEYVFIDCPPSLGLLTLNGLVAADSVLIPLQCEYYALEGIGQLLEAIDKVRQGPNPWLEIEGVLLTMYDSRTRLAQQVASEVREYFKDKVYETVVPRNVRLSEAPGFGKPIILYDLYCTGALSYVNLAKEVMDSGKESIG